jgi:hypothetical protein
LGGSFFCPSDRALYYCHATLLSPSNIANAGEKTKKEGRGPEKKRASERDPLSRLVSLFFKVRELFSTTVEKKKTKRETASISCAPNYYFLLVVGSLFLLIGDELQAGRRGGLSLF